MLETQETLNGSISSKSTLNASLGSEGLIRGSVNNGVFIPPESDPTVPSWVKDITQKDIDRWNKEEVVINSISFETIEEIVNGSYIPDEDDTTSILGKAILGTMVLQ